MRDIVDIQIIDACRIALKIEGDDAAKLQIIEALLVRVADREPDESAYPVFFEAIGNAGVGIAVNA